MIRKPINKFFVTSNCL